MQERDTEALPIKAVIEELDGFRVTLRQTLKSYVERLESDLTEVRDKVQAASEKKKLSGARLHDMRDMLTLLRSLQIKTEKGRRKDLKKLDSIIADLQMLTEQW